ncbi:MAG: D-alanyl-D-alanine carboxypeptidase family protein [Rudaea sp.]|uniref:M15 family metallopeptidase n=1 Tax=Rudaea sp. TaxID=2136325 RepID=UPI0039E34550
MPRLPFVFAILLQLGALPVAAAPPSQPAATHPNVETAFRFGIPRDYASARGLTSVREPQQLAGIGGRDALGYAQRLIPAAARAWARMRAAAARDGVELRAVSTFRSVEVQAAIVRAKLARGQPIDAILRVNAAPGYSEHHSGRAIDIATSGYAPVEEEFERSRAFAWLTRNAGAYGFGMSYPRDNPHALAYEPWHWCWHGDDVENASPRTQLAVNDDPQTNLPADTR